MAERRGRRSRSSRGVTKTSHEKRSRSSRMELSGDEKTIEGVDVSKVQRTIDDLASAFWTVPEGRHKIRILPPQACFEGDFAFRQDVHYGFEDDDGKQRAVLCLRALDEDCPVCEFVESLRGSDDKDDKKLAGDLRKQAQLITEILVRPAKRVRLWRMPVGVYREIAGWIADASIGDITHAVNGRDIRLSRKGTGRYNTRYSVNTLDRGKIGTKKWRRARNDFGRLQAPRMSYKKLMGLLRRQYNYDGG